MIIKNSKPILAIGHEQSSALQEIINFLDDEGGSLDSTISPTDFFELKNKDKYQYLLAMGQPHYTLERQKVCANLSSLDCVSLIHDSSVISKKFKIPKGLILFPFSTVCHDVTIGEFCTIGHYSGVGHYTTIGRNCIIRAGVLIGGKSHIGNNCVLQLKSAISNHISICDNTIIEGFSNVTKCIDTPGIYLGSRARKKIDN